MIPDPENNRNAYPAEWEAILKQVETRLATGCHRHRIEAIAGMSTSSFADLFKRSPVPAYGCERSRTEKAIAALAEWLAGQEARNIEAPGGHADTPTFQAIYNRIRSTQLSGEAIAIIGGVGVGKSAPAIAFAADYPRTLLRPGAVRVEFTSTDSNQTAALAKIAEALSGTHGSAYRSWQLESEIGKAYRPGDILILDECNELGNAVDIIKSLRNRFDFPIVAIGNPDFGRSIYGGKSTFGALASRMLRLDFPKTTEADAAAWFAWAGLSGAALYDVASAIACRAGPTGGLRSLALLVRECRASFPDQPISAAMLRDVATSYGRGIQIRRVA